MILNPHFLHRHEPAMKTATQLTHLGRKPQDHLGVVNPPVYHTSTILFPTLADFELAKKGRYAHSTYGRYGTASTRALEQTLAELEGADYAFVVPSGMAAIATTLLALLAQGDHALFPDTMYDSARHFVTHQLGRYGIEHQFYDPMIDEVGMAALIRPNTKLVYAESPGSNTFEVQDIPAIARAAHAAGALVVADNTYGSPLLHRPYDLGVDVSLYSGSKYISGHSDLMMGVVTATQRVFPALIKMHHAFGNCPGPDDVYLAQRGLRTLDVRMRQHQEGALKVAHWLKNRKEVAKVLHPALPECPGHKIWQRDFVGSNGLFSMVLTPHHHNALAGMMDGMRLFKMGYSWGGFESLMIPCNVANQRSVTTWEHEGPLLRLHVGLEALEDLIADLEDGFARLNAAQHQAA
jgi:cysteine-S-conjugate beta-lyase